jgi:hypothetical protein
MEEGRGGSSHIYATLLQPALLPEPKEKLETAPGAGKHHRPGKTWAPPQDRLENRCASRDLTVITLACPKQTWQRRARDSGRGKEEGRGDRARVAAPRSSSSSRLLQARMLRGRSCQVCVCLTQAVAEKGDVDV